MISICTLLLLCHTCAGLTLICADLLKFLFISVHGTEACDYRKNGGMRLVATVCIADIHDWNAEKIASQTLAQAFLLNDANWLMAQAGRHWEGDHGHFAGEGGGEKNNLVNDPGRKSFEFRDVLSDCVKLAEEGLCLLDPKYACTKVLTPLVATTSP